MPDNRVLDRADTEYNVEYSGKSRHAKAGRDSVDNRVLKERGAGLDRLNIAFICGQSVPFRFLGLDYSLSSGIVSVSGYSPIVSSKALALASRITKKLSLSLSL